MRQLRLKRALDLCGAAGLLILLALPMVLIAVLIRLTLPGPVFYVQERAGRHGRPFRMVKFRTMLPGSDQGSTRLHRDDPRITGIGRWLRRFSIDELPQLVNVLTGEMSLVGPRPMLPPAAARLAGAERRRLHLPPGLTGWAQINGRNAISWPERLALDLWYVDHWSFGLDLAILLRTVQSAAGGRGLYGPEGWNRGYR